MNRSCVVSDVVVKECKRRLAGTGECRVSRNLAEQSRGDKVVKFRDHGARKTSRRALAGESGGRMSRVKGRKRC